MKYGYFHDSNMEYIVTDPKTPVKWINYIGTLGFGGFIDQTGGSLICKGDPAINRIIKYIPQIPASDFKGETVYIRIKESSGYKVFSPLFVPTLDNYEKYECHVGCGYSRYISVFYGIKTELLVFIPRNGDRVLRKITITNLNENDVELDVIPVVEYTHFDALKQLTNADWVPQTMQSRAIREENGMVTLTQYAFMNKETAVNYFTSNHPASSFESDRKNFLGNNEYGTWKNPLSLLKDELGNYEAHRGDNIAALLHHLGKLGKGRSKTIITQLGQCSDAQAEKAAIEMYRKEKKVDEAFEELKLFWRDYLDKIKVQTPDAGMNSMLNIHNPRQCYITMNWSRYLSLYQLGFGARGIGFRDSSQDVLGVMGHVPEEARALMVKLLSVQKRDGSAMHQFNPVTMVATAGDSREYEDRPKYYGDDHLWIILSVCSYLKETGNFEFLKENIPFYDKDKAGKAIESGTVLEHLKRAIEFTEKNVGAHGLPLLGFADWNDTVNLPAGAESLFIANQYGVMLNEMIELMKYLNDEETAERYSKYYESMKEKVNACSWDGEWYVRYFDHEGNPIGSNKNRQGKIYVNSQSWALMSGFATPERAAKALNSVNKLLNTKNGIKLSYPGYEKYDPFIGGVSTYPPGAKENGGIFLHCNPWVMIAETMAGNGERALEYYSQINPANKNEIMDEYECEPYCYPQNILGNEHLQFGLGRNSWLSGTSSWVYQAAIKYILGIMPTYEGLKINPCIPKGWNGFRVTKQFRNAVYEIEITNPNNVNKGVKEISVDGKAVETGILPVFADSKIHQVKVIMG